jgi:hypothetical protein
MSQLLEHIFLSTHGVSQGAPRDISRFTPQQIREAIASLVEKEQITLACALSEAGLSLYPQSEDVLSISALLCCTVGDWVCAEARLRELLALQGNQAPVSPWLMLVRSLRCQLEPLKAAAALRDALVMHPHDESLLAEEVAVQALVAMGAGHASAPQLH